MKILVISTCSPCDLYLIRAVAAHFPVCSVIRPVPARDHGLNWKHFLRRPLKLLHGAANQRYMAHRSSRSNDWVSEALFGADAPSLPGNLVDIRSTEINHSATVERITACAPDVILVSGGPVLAPEIFNIPSLASLNIHYGIAPNYRGEHTLFWPLKTGDYQHIGITIHHIARGIDTGRPLVRGFPRLDRHDTERSILLKCVRMAPRILLPILETLGQTGVVGPLKSARKSTDGLFIRHQDRTLKHDLGYGIRRHLGRARPPAQPERIEKLYRGHQ